MSQRPSDVDMVEPNLSSNKPRFLQQNGGGEGANGLVNGSMIETLDDDDNAEIELYMEVVRRVETLEKLKYGLDERESQLRSKLKGKYEEEKAAMKESSEMLIEKEGLRDQLIRLKDAREKLIDELQVLKSVDEEMSSFNRVNDQFNESLRKHLHLLEEKQARIYTLKPFITGTHAEAEVDFAGKDRHELYEATIEYLKGCIDQVDEQIRKICDENNIRTNAEHNKLIQEEKQVKARIRTLKQKIKDAQKEKGRKRKDDEVEEEEANDDDERGSSISRVSSKGKLSTGRGKKRLRPDGEEYECEACGKISTDPEAHAYHCFRGCSQLEDYCKERGRDISVNCPECSDPIGSFKAFSDHLKNVHGWESCSPEAEGKKSGGSHKKSSRR